MLRNVIVILQCKTSSPFIVHHLLDNKLRALSLKYFYIASIIKARSSTKDAFLIVACLGSSSQPLTPCVDWGCVHRCCVVVNIMRKFFICWTQLYGNYLVYWDD